MTLLWPNGIVHCPFSSGVLNKKIISPTNHQAVSPRIAVEHPVIQFSSDAIDTEMVSGPQVKGSTP